jgi:hypothetical protein
MYSRKAIHGEKRIVTKSTFEAEVTKTFMKTSDSPSGGSRYGLRSTSGE